MPVNLCAPVPDGVDPATPPSPPVGAIAMQGLRQAELGLGEVAVVIGLGLIGQLLVQLLDAAGVRVVGVDISEARCRLAEEQGAVPGRQPRRVGRAGGRGWARSRLARGADAVFLAAGGNTNQPVELAAELARDRGRVVDIGKCSLDLPWNAYYEKELDVRFSRSYGPGRYDPCTRRRASTTRSGTCGGPRGATSPASSTSSPAGGSTLEPLVSAVVAFADAVATYERMNSGELKGIGFLFEYPADVASFGRVARSRRRSPPRHRFRAGGRPLRLGFIGAGNYASTMLLPHLAKRDDRGAGRGGHGHAAVRRERAAQVRLRASHDRPPRGARRSGHRRRLRRHPALASHARFVCRGAAGRQGGVRREAARAERAAAHRCPRRHPATRATTGCRSGFNRRFAPLLVELRAALRSPHAARHGPLPRQRRAAGRHELVQPGRRRGQPLRRRRRPLPRHARLVARGRSGRRGAPSTPAGQRTTSTSPCRSPTAPPGPSPTPRRAAPSSRRRRSTSWRTGRSRGSTTSAAADSGRGRATAARSPSTPTRARRAEVGGVRRGRPPGHPDADPGALARERDAGDPGRGGVAGQRGAREAPALAEPALADAVAVVVRAQAPPDVAARGR